MFSSLEHDYIVKCVIQNYCEGLMINTKIYFHVSDW
jgi:hypothetical protein